MKMTLKRGWLGWVALLLVTGVGSACTGARNARPGTGAAEPLPIDFCRTHECRIDSTIAQLIPTCQSGTCDPGSLNGKGIYIANERHYCFVDASGEPRFCPEAFINRPMLNRPAAVALRLRDFSLPKQTYEPLLSATLALPTGEIPITLLGISGTQTQLSVTYGNPADGTVHTARGTDLGPLRLRFPVDSNAGTLEYELRLDPLAPNPRHPKELHRYALFYRLTAAGPEWRSHCMDDGVARPVTFLGGKRIDGLTAAVTDEQGETTVSCETGAIEACLAWGYTPWNTRTGNPAASEYLYRSCLQAKRAAYFVGLGDFKSYTKNGTRILRRDAFGINTERIDGLEALWSPQGAECLNVEHLRLKDAPDDEPARIFPGHLQAQVPPCPPAQWSRHGRLATGPAPAAH